MNVWIAKLGLNGFTEPELEKIAETVHGYHALKENILFQYRAQNVHYVSICTKPSFGGKTYNYRDDKSNSLFAYSGLLVGKGETGFDYRSASIINKKIVKLADITSDIVGQYAIIKAGDQYFECIVDFLGCYKVFYYTDTGRNTAYVSNNLSLVRLFKPLNKNYEFVAERICMNCSYGYFSEENDVFTLPEYGRLVWTSSSGVQLKQYANLSRLFQNDKDSKELLVDTANELKSAAEYLTQYHDCVVPLSGGSDSRLVLNMFWGIKNKRVESYTFLDDFNDIRIARSVAAAHNVPHQVIKPKKLPGLDELHEFAKEEYGFEKGYKVVFEYLFHEQIKAFLSEKLKAVLFGHGGDYGEGWLKIKNVAEDAGDEDLIKSYLEALLSSCNILTAEGREIFRTRLCNYFMEKYLPFLDGVNSKYKLYQMRFQLERVRYSKGNIIMYSSRDSDIFLPLVSESFICAALASPPSEMFRYQKNSRYYQLEQLLTGGNAPALSFSGHTSWDFKTTEKAKYNFLQYRKRVLSLIFKALGGQYSNTYAKQVRLKFFNQNKKNFLEILHAAPQSVLWDYINREEVMSWFAGNYRIRYPDIKWLFHILPVLKSELDQKY